MGVAEEEKVQGLLLGSIACGEKGLLDAVGVAVAEEKAHILHAEELFCRGFRPQVAVPGDLMEGDVRKAAVETLAVPPRSPKWTIIRGADCSTARSILERSPWESERTKIFIRTLLFMI